MRLLTLFLFVFFGLVKAEVIRVYAAADLQFALRELADLYMKKYPEDKIELIFGSSGKGFAQIKAGAPYHIFFSADMKYVEELYREGYAITKPKPYAIGRIVLWTRKDSGLDPSKFPEVLLDPRVKRIAIANWDHAPYGKASKEALEAYGVFQKVKDKLVIGENIAQTASYIRSGAADLGFIALSLAKAPELERVGRYWLVPEDKHERILQGYVITKEGQKVVGARRFYEFVASTEARKVFVKYGFLLPGER
ncbi:MAG: molybdate ABC transporter substrate-binding protein [Aquificaceae bacterium]|nr:molybdate ABC transporter substrate-binding protein [Aquificaceae bacterium]